MHRVEDKRENEVLKTYQRNFEYNRIKLQNSKDFAFKKMHTQ